MCLLYDAAKPNKLGSTVPIKLRICAAAGVNASAPAVTVTAEPLTKISNDTTAGAVDAGNALPLESQAGIEGQLWREVPVIVTESGDLCIRQVEGLAAGEFDAA